MVNYLKWGFLTTILYSLFFIYVEMTMPVNLHLIVPMYISYPLVLITGLIGGSFVDRYDEELSDEKE